MHIKENITRIKGLLNVVANDLDFLTDENFDFKLKEVQNCLKEVQQIKFSLKNTYNNDILQPYENELSDITKQIGKKFDYLIKARTEESIEVNKQLANIQNQKKLTLYDR
ncbi:MAG: hypothetical protein Q8903_00435 [Bacteroidota bacterium]|nr:hypothetical protein [Bacteroidota bacterium]